MTPEDIVSIAPNGSVMRHALFIRYVLGEDWRTAVLMAVREQGQPLGSDDMRYIAHHWTPTQSGEGG